MLFRLREGNEHLEPLGAQRLRLVSCLDSSQWSIHFEPLRGEDILAAFREWVGKVVRQQGEASGPGSGPWLALIGAARLLTGDLAGADLIVENLPVQPHVIDHGAGYCLVLPMQVLLTAVPLSAPRLRNISRWLAGSAEQAELRTWLRQHQDRLVWDEPRGVYTLSAASAGTPDIDSDESQLPIAPPRRRRLSAAKRWLIATLVIAALWSYLKWWVP